MKKLLLPVFILMGLVGCQQTRPPADHVVIIGVDGLSPDGIRMANTPAMDGLMQRGAFTLHARAVMPSSSGANWGSMIMGTGPEQHGVISNDWRTDNLVLPPTVVGDDNHFPTIFSVLRDQRPDWHLAAFLHWNPIQNFIEEGVTDYMALPRSEEETTDEVLSYFQEHQPEFTFIHLDHVDGAGHRYGHGTAPYYRSVEKADSLIGEIIEATRRNGMFERTVFILSSDHGGIGYGHGGNSLAEMEIPFLVSGSGTKPGHELLMPVNVYDVPATALFALGVDQPYEWTARPAKNAFQGNPDPQLRYHFNRFQPAPAITPAGEGGFNPPGGLFIGESPTVSIQNPSESGIIRYTTDGSQPVNTSDTYAGPFSLNETTVVKARLFENERPVSDEITAYFRIPADTTGRGLYYHIFEAEGISRLPDFNRLRPVAQGVTMEISSNNLMLTRPDYVAAVLEGYIEIPQDGRYTFSLASDDGSKLYINRRLVIDNDGDHGVITVSNSLLLGAGRHPIRVEWFNGGGGYWLAAYIEGSTLPRQIISPEMLYRRAN
ncbi:MAG: phosphodiesterase [Bacteroidetes bacterium HLUCCA01]|nr:MAG: phosphodiesterase [Bacteroidetes bacterium HLUCCA01]